MLSRVRMRIDYLLRSERGIALPVAMLITAIALAMATVPIVASVNSQSGDRRDQASDSALAAADAGVDIAIERQTQMASFVSSTKPCVSVSGSTLVATAASSGWCNTVTLTSASSPPAPPGTKITYRVKPTYTSSSTGTNAMTVYSVGTVETGGRTVTRQLAVEATSKPGTSATKKFLGSEGISGDEWLTFGGGGNTTYGNVGTNGKFTFIGGSNRVCGSIRYGEGFPNPVPEVSWRPVDERPYVDQNNNGVCYPLDPPDSKIYAAKVTYPTPEAPSDLKTNNSNGRFFSEDGRDLPSWYLANPINSWNPTTRTLSIDSGVTLTLSGTKPYFLCRLRLEGGATIRTQAPGQPVSIWFDKPSNCPSLPSVNLSTNGVAAKQQLVMQNGSHFTNNGYYPGLYFLGGTSSERTLATVNIQDFNGLIYGPMTDFESLGGGLQLSGAVVARSVVVNGGGRINSTFKGETYEIPVKGASSPPGAFARTKYLECAAGATPGVGC